MEDARSIRNLLNGLHSRYNRKVIEQAAIAGVLTPSVTGDPARAAEAAAYIARRLDAARRTKPSAAGNGRFDSEGFHFERMVRGVKDAALIDQALLGSADARKLDEYAPTLQELYAKPGTLRRKGEDTAIYGPVGLFDAVTGVGRKGISMQRYKGLGEMNPEQLWETTLDIDVRSLLQVKVREVDDADDIFGR